MKCQYLFSGKNKKKYLIMLSAEIFIQNAKCLKILSVSLRNYMKINVLPKLKGFLKL